VGRTFLDRELYLPAVWTQDRDRCAAAGIGPDVEFATKPQLAMRMLTRALDAGVPAAWVAGDEVYGQYSKLRVMLEERGVGYVLAVPVNQHVHTRLKGQLVEIRADALAARLPTQAWKKISAGRGAKGPRVYHWARAAVRPLETTGRGYWLLARRSLSDPSDLAYYLCHGPADTPLRELVRVAGARWAIEESFQSAKGEVGLDHYQVRRYDAWYRHITLAILAHAFLTVTRTRTAKGGPIPATATSPSSSP
jgi:SRSO17 transposase